MCIRDSPENERGGIMDMRRAIVESSNAYFYSLANELGVDTMHDFMKPLGFGQITGIDINGEVRGVLPSQAWKRSYFKRPEQQKWYAGETISLGIGQGYNSFTMLQLAQATAIIANNGIKHTPHLVIATQDASTRVSVPVVPQPAQNLGFKQANVDIIRQAMVGVTQQGTSTRVFAGAGYLSAGKTGTAQAVTIGQKDKYDARKLEERLRKPVIAAVAGFALGGGCELAMMCDFIIAADSAKFGQPEIKLGIIPGAGGTQRLPRAIGKAKAMDLVLTARMMDAVEAERAGLVSRIVPADKLLDEALGAAAAINALGGPSVLAAKECINRAYEGTLSDGIMVERRLFHALFATADKTEGMDAFLNKRKPAFKRG